MMTGIGVHDQSDSVFTFDRNGRSGWSGIRTVGFLLHDVLDEPIERGNPVPRLAPAKQARPVDIPRRQVRPGTAPTILVLDVQRPARRDRRRGMAALTGLNAGLLVGRDHIVARPQRAALPLPGIEIQHRTGALGKARVARKQPTPMAPRPNRVGIQPAPEGRLADGRHEAAGQDFAAQLRHRPAALRPPSAAHRRSASPQRRRWGEKRAGRPPRGSSSRPARRWSKKRWRHLLTIWRGRSTRAAMTSLESPSAASKTSFARMTSRYGDVYVRARASSARRSFRVSRMTYGLCRGMEPAPPHVEDSRIGPPEAIQNTSQYLCNPVLRFTGSVARWGGPQLDHHCRAPIATSTEVSSHERT